MLLGAAQLATSQLLPELMLGVNQVTDGRHDLLVIHTPTVSPPPPHCRPGATNHSERPVPASASVRMVVAATRLYANARNLRGAGWLVWGVWGLVGGGAGAGGGCGEGDGVGGVLCYGVVAGVS